MSDTSWAVAHPVRGHVRRRGRPPASDSAVTRERILRAARKVFAEAGYEAATFQAIALEIGLTRPAINNYFASKSALYSEVLSRVSRTVVEAVRRAGNEPNLAAQLTEFLRLTVRGEDADPALAGIVVQSAMQPAPGRPSGGDTAAHMVAAHIERFVCDAVDAARQRGELRGDVVVEALCDALTALVWGTAFQVSRGLSRDSQRADRMLGEFEWLLRQAISTN